MFKATVALAVALGSAPLQCGHEADPAYRREETPGDALWGLAADFRAKGDEASARQTLQYLVERYPSSRYATSAKEQLAQAPRPPATLMPPADAGPTP